MPPSSYEEFRSRRSFGSLDGIRCLSIVAVVWHHTVSGLDWLPATKRGFLGVDMFFVLSGFLIVTLLLRERARTGAISLPKFYARRALRIFPAYYGLLAAIALVFGSFKQSSSLAGPFFAELPYYLTYTANWVELHTMLAIAWSLAAEEQFYLVWPPIEKLAGRIAIPLLLVIIAVNQAVNFRLLDAWILSRTGLDAAGLPMLQATFTPICLGVLLAHVLHSRRGFGVASRAFSSAWASPLCLAVVLVLADLRSPDISGWQRLLIQLSMTAFLCSCVAREDHALRRALIFAPVARIGVISYGVYLFHPIARHAADLVLQKASLDLPLLLFATCLSFTIVAAEISYRYYEAPFLRMKDWLHARNGSGSA
jgi:peptidoglycan/LPS O-acetylase OafA/YrhL